MGDADLILAVDIGTGATKAMLFDSNLKQVGLVKKPYPIKVPAFGWSEQEPEVIYLAVAEAIRESLKFCPPGRRIKTVSLSSQLYSILAVDGRGKPLTRSIPWSDTRSAGQVSELRQDPISKGISRRTGCPIDSVYPLAKIKWLKDNKELPTDVRFISIKEYILYRLCGQFLVDWSIASATGLFDIKSKSWDNDALGWVGITPENLSKLVSPYLVLEDWVDEARNLCGVGSDLPIVIGGGDGPLASLGVGSPISEGLAVNVGTSAAARALVRSPNIDPQGHLWTYLIVDGLWVTGGMVSSGGIVFEWFLGNFFSDLERYPLESIPESLYNDTDRLVGQVPPGAEGLLFIPYLSGAQSPDWSPGTRGSFICMDLKHRRGHLARAVLEGITRSIYRIAEAIQKVQGVQFQEIYVTGGLTASRVWLQIAADMFGATVVLPETSEGSARGAALLAAVSLGMRSRLDDFQDLFAPKERILPDEQAHEYYQEQHQRFMKALNYTKRL
jgi:gluconokinase